MIVMARKAMAHTPKADASFSPLPNALNRAYIAVVIGKYACLVARMRESETSSMAKAKANKPPARTFAEMSGRVILRNALNGLAPRFCAASSNDTLVCSNPAAADRHIRQPPHGVSNDEKKNRVLS